MTRYLLDTNIVLRLCNPSDVQHLLVTDALSLLLAQGDECLFTSQVIVEFWVVATRPVEVNGLGWTPEQTRSRIDEICNRFPMLEDTSQIFTNWLDLVTNRKVKGKRAHDARIIAAMLAHGITHILTLNPSDFAISSSITIVRPQDLITGS
jgi:predicted nucleic acid-binding protein